MKSFYDQTSNKRKCPSIPPPLRIQRNPKFFQKSIYSNNYENNPEIRQNQCTSCPEIHFHISPVPAPCETTTNICPVGQGPIMPGPTTPPTPPPSPVSVSPFEHPTKKPPPIIFNFPNMTDKEIAQIMSRPDPVEKLFTEMRNLPLSIEPSKERKKANDDYENEIDQWSKALTTTIPPVVIQPITNRQLTPSYSETPEIPSSKIINDCFLNLMGPGVFPDRTRAQPGNLGHDPRGLTMGFRGQITPTEQDWGNAIWDGTPYDYNNKTKEEIWNWLLPVGNNLGGILRGIELLYYSSVPIPFADKFAPTTIEIDEWNIKVINHIRNMLGITKKVTGDPRLFLEATWADERRLSTVWNDKYPGILNSANGPCQIPGSQGHCGATFFPDAQDRQKYILSPPYLNNMEKYPELASYTQRQSKAEGTGGVSNRIPWSLRMAMIVTNYIKDEGTTGHAGPALFRDRVGISWQCTSSGIGFRGKWS